MSTLKPTSALGDIPGHAYLSLEEHLNQGMWEPLARQFTDALGRPRYSEKRLRQLSRSSAPGRELLALCKRDNMEVQVLQQYLRHLSLREHLDRMVTNVPLRVVACSSNTVCAVGGDVRLAVCVDASPEPRYQWLHHEQPCGTDSHVLHIQNFRLEDQGVYECVMTQTLEGRVVEARCPPITVGVMDTPPTIFTDLQEEVVLKKGEDLRLVCEADGYPVPQYSWYKDGHLLKGYTTSELKMMSVDRLVCGRYHCEVTNAATQEPVRSTTATVKVCGPVMTPEVPQVLRQPQVKGGRYSLDDRLDLSFQVLCRHPATLTCYVNQVQITDDRVSCTSSGEGHYTCHLHYTLAKDEWFRNRKKPFTFQFAASANGATVLSETVQVAVESNFGPKSYTARNKYALLVCNSDYPVEYRLHSPVDDSRMLAQELRKMQFRCFICSNVNYSDFKNLVLLFMDFVQEGDYVVFYFAGHGFHNKGIDFLMPIDCRVTRVPSRDNIQGPPREIVDQTECVSTTWVSNQIQKCRPALFFSILDSCRNILSPELNLPMRNYQRYAGENSYTLYSTSEYYVSNEDGSSYLISKLLNIISNKVSVPELCQQFKQEFSQLYAPNQIPKIEGDLVQNRSLTDPCNPTQEDKDTILDEWENLAALGGVHTAEITVGGKPCKVHVQCVNSDMSEGSDEVAWILANYMTVRVWLSDPAVAEGGMMATLTFSNGQKGREKGPGVINFDVTGLEKIKDPLKLTLQLKFPGKGESVTREFDLDWPSLSKQNSVINNL